MVRRAELYFWRHLVMPFAWRVDLWFVHLHTYAFAKASKLERKKK